MNAREAANLRLFNQQIARPSSTSAAQVVSRLGAIQAQDYNGALWAIGLRLPGSTVADVERAIADREIVRTWPMRRTLHFVAAQDVRWMLKLLTPRMVKGMAGRLRQLELDEPSITKSAKAIEKAMRDGQTLTREEIYAVLERAKVSAGNQRGIHILSRLSQEGLVCFASHRAKKPTFALLDEWIPKSRELAGDEALAELTLRYFRGHGPATARDFSWWAGTPLGVARAGIALVASELEEIRIGDASQFVARDAEAAPPITRTVHLLPPFDEYLLGYTDRSIVLEARHANKIVPGSNGMFLATIVAGGRVVGTWRTTQRQTGARVAPAFFATPSARDEQALAKCAKRYAHFTKRITDVPARPARAPSARRPSGR